MREKNIGIEIDSVRAYSRRLQKSDDPDDKVKFKDVYERYALFCQKWKLEVEKRMEFRKILGELGFKIGNSTKDSNQLYIFNARLISEEEIDDEEWPSFPKSFGLIVK